MTIEKLEIPLHDCSLVQVLRTDSGAIYLELYGPGHAKDGHGYILKGSTLLAETHISALVALLTSSAGRAAA